MDDSKRIEAHYHEGRLRYWVRFASRLGSCAVGPVHVHGEPFQWRHLGDLLVELQSYRTYFSPEAREMALEAVAKCDEAQSACRTLCRDGLWCDRRVENRCPEKWGNGACPYPLPTGATKCPYYSSPNCCPTFNSNGNFVGFRGTVGCALCGDWSPQCLPGRPCPAEKHKGCKQ